LEKALGATLVERSLGNTFRLTDSGRVAVEQARKMLDITVELRRMLDGRDSKVNGSIRFTITEGLASFWLLGALQPFLENNPGLHIDWMAHNDTRA
jgi:DNA-binding transcriptional LysR family regulator